jgi:hypothetical protein
MPVKERGECSHAIANQTAKEQHQSVFKIIEIQRTKQVQF